MKSELNKLNPLDKVDVLVGQKRFGRSPQCNQDVSMRFD